MMRNPAAAGLIKQLRALVEGGIRFHAQVVLCPGENDGDVLRDTIEALAGLHPAALSLAVVPVGLTGHREGLYQLRPVDRQLARDTLAIIEAYQRTYRAGLGTAFVYAADELYLTAGQPIPGEAEYEDYPQLENGVGLISLLQTQYQQAWREAGLSGMAGAQGFAGAAIGADVYDRPPRRVVVLTASAASPYIARLLDEMPVPGIKAQVIAVDNDYFGGHVNVAGLLSGCDIANALEQACALEPVPDVALITETMLRPEERDFLDGITFDSLRERCAGYTGVSGRCVELKSVAPGGADLLNALISARNGEA